MNKALEMGMDLDEWLEATAERRQELLDYASKEMPIDKSERAGESEKVLKNEDDAARLLADAETFLVMEQGKAIMTVRTKYPGYTADERKVAAKVEVVGIQRLVDGLSATHKTISNRRFMMMNANRARA